MPKTNRYAKLDTDTFDRLLRDVINTDNPTAADVLSVPGVYEILSEHYNNDVLSAYDDEQALAFDEGAEGEHAARELGEADNDDQDDDGEADVDQDEADRDRTMHAQPHCATCGCDLHDGQCPEGHPQPTDDQEQPEP